MFCDKNTYKLLEPLWAGYRPPEPPRLAPPARRRRQSGGSGGTVAPPERPLAPEAPVGGVRGA
eukprot:15480294-Alexandrium_andersonii.AAC.1